MILKVREKVGKKYILLLNEELYCRCYPKDLRDIGFMDFFDGQTLDVTESALITFEQNVFLPRAKRRSLFLLGKKEYTKKELEKKLFADGYPESVINAVITYLSELHYVNDTSFAERYALHLMERCSKREIYQKMQQKGFEKELIVSAMESAKETYQLEHANEAEAELSPELTAICTFLRKKGFSVEATDAEKKKKLVMALYRKGFSLSDIRSVMGEFEVENNFD